MIFLLRDDHVWLLRRSDTGYMDGRYAGIAGHVEGGEEVAAAAVREAYEEAGVRIDRAALSFVGAIHSLGAQRTEGIHFVFRADRWSGAPVNNEPGKCDRARWCPVGELPRRMEPLSRAALELGVRGRPWYASVRGENVRRNPNPRTSTDSTIELDAAPRQRPASALVVVPTYDEAACIEQALRRTLAADPRVEALVVDDGSPDGTASLVETLFAADSRVHLLRRDRKQGLASAYQAGFGWGLERGYDALLEMDADLSHPPELIGQLIDGLLDADVVIGSRYVPGGRVVNVRRGRRLLSRTINRYARAALRLPVHDITAGFRAYRSDAAEAIVAAGVVSLGYCFQIEGTWRARNAGCSIAELPITFSNRERGSSKLRARIVIEAFWLVTVWGMEDRVRALRGRLGRSRVGS